MRRYTWRSCTKCKKTKHFLEFDKYRTKNQRKPACIECTRAKVAGNGPHESQAPCLGCGNVFFVDGPHSRAMLRKTCSKECAYASMRKAARPCQHCHRILSFDQFARKNTARTRKLTCLECERDILARKAAKSRHEHMPHVFLSLTESVTHGRCFAVAEAARMIGQPCNDCGEKATQFALVDHAKPWLRENVDVLCDICTMTREAMGACVAGNAQQICDFILRHTAVNTTFERGEACLA